MRLIDADELKNAINNCDVCKKCPIESQHSCYECEEPGILTPGMERVIDAQPTVDAVKHGTWVHGKNAFVDYFECSYCHYFKVTCSAEDFDNWLFCPKCGAKMDGVSDVCEF